MMADSDEEYDRRRRDKARRDRNEYEGKNRSGDYATYGRKVGNDFSSKERHGLDEPFYKRSRREWSGDNRVGDAVEQFVNYPTQPPMLLFKHFLTDQDDEITDDDAILKYKEYKANFQKKQLRVFFDSHKDDEWFKEKYHPNFAKSRLEKQQQSVAKRKRVFMYLYENGWVNRLKVHLEYTCDMTRFLDACVILLEGGKDVDLKALDADVVSTKTDSSKKKDNRDHSSRKFRRKNSGEYEDLSDDSKDEEEGEQCSSASTSSTSSDSDNDSDNASNASKNKKEKKSSKRKKTISENDNEKVPLPVSSSNTADDAEVKSIKLADTDAKSGDASDDAEKNGEPASIENTSILVEPQTIGNSDSNRHVDNGYSEFTARDQNSEAKPLHKTYSIFFRNIHPKAVRSEILELVSSTPGFMRLALQDPTPERNFYRRGWVTFDRSVVIKEICWNLNNVRLHDSDIGALVNRDISQRIRPVTVLTNQKQVMRQDIKFAAKLVSKYDRKNALWIEAMAVTDSTQNQANPTRSGNPLLKNITDYLVDEADCEEEILLKGDISATVDSALTSCDPLNIQMDVDEALAKVLDRLILYLRIVHSVDYYSATEYYNEDEMPHRCGMMHVRGVASRGERNVTLEEVENHLKSFERKGTTLLESVDALSDKDAEKLGLKDPEAEAETFIKENTKELAADKWLCPLSGKKFKGPEFVRKHIMNKHIEKYNAVKDLAEYFNNYLRDPRRPHLPEHPSNRPGGAHLLSNVKYSQGSRQGQRRGAPYHSYDSVDEPSFQESKAGYDGSTDKFAPRNSLYGGGRGSAYKSMGSYGEGNRDAGYGGNARPRNDFGNFRQGYANRNDGYRGGRFEGGRGRSDRGGFSRRPDYGNHYGKKAFSSMPRKMLTYNDLDAPLDE